MAPTYTVPGLLIFHLCSRQWVGENQLEPLFTDEVLDEAKLEEPRKSVDKLKVRVAYSKARRAYELFSGQRDPVDEFMWPWPINLYFRQLCCYNLSLDLTLLGVDLCRYQTTWPLDVKPLDLWRSNHLTTGGQIIDLSILAIWLSGNCSKFYVEEISF